MAKKATILVLVVSLLLAAISPISVSARSELTIISSSTQVVFPTSLTFNLLAQSDVNITDVRLHYIVDQQYIIATVTSEAHVEIVPAATVDATWTWDMRKTGGLPPGAIVCYWWTVTDAGGNKVETPQATVQFDDNRYPWRSLEQGQITLYWYEGDDSFAQELMANAQQGLLRLERETGAKLDQPVKLYIYADSRDLQGAMVYPQEWTGGAAYTGHGIMVIGIPPASLDWGKKAITHELTHLVIHQVTFNPYNEIPTWLDEGLAMYNQGALDPEFTAFFNSAIERNSLISVRSLSSPFSAYYAESILSYAESYSLVQFLITNYGQNKMLELLLTFKEGSRYDEAVQKVYGFDMDGLYTLWQSYIAPPVPPAEEKGLPAVLIGALVGLATVLLLALGLAIGSWARRRGR